MLRWSEQALPIYERLDDPEGIARSLHYIAEGLRDAGEFEWSAELYTRSIGDPTRAWSWRRLGRDPPPR
jgi:hypothetical protein